MTDSTEKVQYDVYLGVWTNWSRGRILGATLTLEPRYGLLLLSFTATFVGFVASRFWRIITLVLHRIYSTPEPRDALHHQRQVVLRNSLSAASTLWLSLQLAWCWRAIRDGYLARVLPTIISAASTFCAFTVAGGFTSSIASSNSNGVLIDGSQCGTLVSASLTSDSLPLIYPYLSQIKNNAANYAQQCYSLNSTGTLECTTFVKSRLLYNSTNNASCPFSDNICRSSDSNLLLDSGLISSDDLGLNLPSDERMFYRHVLHCAPLRTDGFKSEMSTMYNNYTRYHYGSSTHVIRNRTDWTYEAENVSLKYMRRDDNPEWAGSSGFNIHTLNADIANGTEWMPSSELAPIPQLIVPDADLLLIFLSPDGVLYLNRTNDPWYRGIVPRDGGLYTNVGTRTVYTPDEAASPMGCALRYQYCDSGNKCGTLGSFADAVVSALALFDRDSSDAWSGGHRGDQSDATASRFEMFETTIVGSTSLSDLLDSLGPSSLMSHHHFSQGVMGPLPDNQWQLDVTYWFEMLLASIQAAFVTTARGPADEAILPYLARPENEYHQAMCRSQKIRSADFTSLSLFGLYFTYVTGIIIIIASYTAEPLLAFFYSRRKYEEYKYLEWAANGTMQLQRLAYQGLGSEKWTDYTDDIPKTRPGYFLADLPRAYPLEDEDNETQKAKPTVHAASTATPSVSDVSTNQYYLLPAQPQGAPSPPNPAAPEPIPQGILHTRNAVPPSPQAMTPSLQAVLPGPQAVSPISQSSIA